MRIFLNVVVMIKTEQGLINGNPLCKMFRMIWASLWGNRVPVYVTLLLNHLFHYFCTGYTYLFWGQKVT